MLGAGIWVVLLVTSTAAFRLYQLGRLWAYGIMGVSLFVFLYFFENVILLERRGFTCKKCGYDLHGLTEHRCPECGTAFDPSERERILARVNAPPPKPTRRWIAALVVVLLGLSSFAGLIAYRRAATRAAIPVPAAPAAAPATAGTGVNPSPSAVGRISLINESTTATTNGLSNEPPEPTDVPSPSEDQP